MLALFACVYIREPVCAWIEILTLYCQKDRENV